MPRDLSLLEQRATKHQEKLEQATAVIAMTGDRASETEATRDAAGSELARLDTLVHQAKGRLEDLKKQRKAARSLSEAADRDHSKARRELAENAKREEKRRAKLAEAQADLAAGRAESEVREAADAGSGGVSSARKSSRRSSAKRPTAKRSSAKKATATKSAAKKTTARKTPAKKTAAKKSPAKKTTAKKSPTKKTTAKKTTAKKSTARRS